MQNSKFNQKIQEDKKAIALLDSLIKQYKQNGLGNVLQDCNSFGDPPLNFIYIEIYSCCKNGQPILALAGAGIFLEEFVNSLWASSQVHKAQLAGKFNTWDEVMNFKEMITEKLESQKVKYKTDVRPVLEKILSVSDLESVEILRDFVRNTFIHSKRNRLIRTLQKNGVLPKKMPLGKAQVSNGKITRIDKVELELTHPLVAQIGFQVLAKQLAPAMLIFVYELFKKYHKYLAPLKDNKIKFPGHECEYD